MAAWHGHLVCLLLLTASCDRVFGLSGTLDATDAAGIDADPCPDDRDCDDVRDPTDNCIDVSNSDQFDADRDGVGDACDPCGSRASLATENSDKDAFVDNADNCPGVANADQLDSDRDGVGDACDGDPASAGRLRCFYSFIDQLNVVTAWALDQTNWVCTQGLILHFGDVLPDTATLLRSGLTPEVDAFSLSTWGHVTDQGTRPAEFGIALNEGATGLGTRCVLTASTTFVDSLSVLGPDDEVLATTPFAAITSNPQWQLRMDVHRSTSSVTCTVSTETDGPFIATAAVPSLPDTPAIQLVARNIAATFFDLSIHELR